MDETIANASPLQHDPKASSPSARASTDSPKAPSGLSVTPATKPAAESMPKLILTPASEVDTEHDSMAARDAVTQSVVVQPSASTSVDKHAQPDQPSPSADPTSASAGEDNAQQLSEPANVAAAESTASDKGKDDAEPPVAPARKKKNKSACKTAQMAAAKLTAAQQPSNIGEPTDGGKDSSQQLCKSDQPAADKGAAATGAAASAVSTDEGVAAESSAAPVSKKKSKGACKTAPLTAAKPTAAPQHESSTIVEPTTGSKSDKGAAVSAVGSEESSVFVESSVAPVSKKKSNSGSKSADIKVANNPTAQHTGKSVRSTVVSKDSTQQLPGADGKAGIELTAADKPTRPAVSKHGNESHATAAKPAQGEQPNLAMQPSIARTGKNSVSLLSEAYKAAAVSNKTAAKLTSAPLASGTVKVAAATDSPAADPAVAAAVAPQQELTACKGKMGAKQRRKAQACLAAYDRPAAMFTSQPLLAVGPAKGAANSMPEPTVAAADAMPQQEPTADRVKMGAKQRKRAQHAAAAVLDVNSAAPAADASTVPATAMPAAPAEVPATPLSEPSASAKKGNKLAVRPVHIPAADGVSVDQPSFAEPPVTSAAASALGSSGEPGKQLVTSAVASATAKAKSSATDESAAQLPSHAKPQTGAATATGAATQTPAAHVPPSAASTHVSAAAFDTSADISARYTSRVVSIAIDCTTPALADKPCAVSITVISPQQVLKARKASLVAKQRRKAQAQLATDVALGDQTFSQPAEEGLTTATSQMAIACAFVAPTVPEAKVSGNGNVISHSLTELRTTDVIPTIVSPVADTLAPSATTTHTGTQGPAYNDAAAGQAADASLVKHAATASAAATESAANSPVAADATLVNGASAEHAAGNAGALQAAGNSDAELASANATAATEVTLVHALSQQHAADKLVIIHATDNAADVAGAEHTVGKLGLALVAVPPAGPLTAADPMTSAEEAAAATRADAKHVTAKLATIEQVTGRLVAVRHSAGRASPSVQVTRGLSVRSPPSATSADHAIAILRGGPATAKHLAPNAIAAETASAKLHKDSSVAQCASSALPDHAASTSGQCPPQSAVGKVCQDTLDTMLLAVSRKRFVNVWHGANKASKSWMASGLQSAGALKCAPSATHGICIAHKYSATLQFKIAISLAMLQHF